MRNNSSTIKQKTTFFEFRQDSLKSRTINCTTPTNTQTFSLNSSIISDYIGNSKVSIITGVISSKKDSAIAIHSLINGTGNISFEVESPLGVWQTRKKNMNDFIGFSFNPRVSAIINNNQSISPSMVNYDFGFNLAGKLTGDLGLISVKYILRNSFCIGNSPFIKMVFGLNSKNFYYTSIQIKIKSGPNVFSIIKPVYLSQINSKFINNLPLYFGYSISF